MKHIFLIGFMGAGKSSVGRRVAERLGLPFVDLDAEIERRSGCRIAEIFRIEGEERFRALERDALSEAVDGPPSVIACGGGIVLRDENRQMMKERGTVVYLAVSAEEALARIGDAGDRPLLAGDARNIAPQILGARLSLYQAAADITVDTTRRSVEEVSEEVVRLLGGLAHARLRVETEPPYEILIGAGAVAELPSAVRAAAEGAVAVISDEQVAALYGDVVTRMLAEAGIAATLLTMPAGESSKSWEQAGALLEQMVAAGLDRTGAVVSLGGGVTGDLAGFVASVYMRGIPAVHVPTTLLAQVDSAIGGKTGVDLAAGKNLAGTFWQPAAVIADSTFLHTLPEPEWANGLVEVVKTGLLAGGPLWDLLAEHAGRLAEHDDGAVRAVVESCVRFKAEIVSQDAHESSGVRECLNLGHTLGHAIEREMGYGTVPHGVAVAEGLRFALRLSVEATGASEGLVERTGSILDTLGVPRIDRASLDPERLLAAMRSDKKARSGVVRFVLVERPGVWTVREIGDEALAAALRRWCHGE